MSEQSQTTNEVYHIIAAEREAYCDGETHKFSVSGTDRPACARRVVQWFKPIAVAFYEQQLQHIEAWRNDPASPNAKHANDLRENLRNIDNEMLKFFDDLSFKFDENPRLPDLVRETGDHWYTFYVYKLSFDLKKSEK